MKDLNTKVLKNAYSVLDEYRKENEGMIFNISSLMRYCIENDIRAAMKNRKMKDFQIDSIFDALNLNICFKVDRLAGEVRFNLKYK
ncbi:MAG TPA: hypothetical protein QF753_07290 [Victivallales bacterium]|nr:hypothetical protein [Victivallales bacterium]